MIAIGRSLLANPDWAERVRRGEATTLRSFTKDFLHHLL